MRKGPLSPIPRTIEQRKNEPHPIEDPSVQADVRAWTVTVLSTSGTGKVIVEFDFHEWQCQYVRLGGTTTRKRS